MNSIAETSFAVLHNRAAMVCLTQPLYVLPFSTSVTRPGRSITSGLVDERGLSLKRSSVKGFLFGAQRFRRRYPACPQSGNECCDKR
jgi:hypothetical protein